MRQASLCFRLGCYDSTETSCSWHKSRCWRSKHQDEVYEQPKTFKANVSTVNLDAESFLKAFFWKKKEKKLVLWISLQKQYVFSIPESWLLRKRAWCVTRKTKECFPQERNMTTEDCVPRERPVFNSLSSIHPQSIQIPTHNKDFERKIS